MNLSKNILYQDLVKLRKKIVSNIPDLNFKKTKSTNLDYVTNADYKIQKLIIAFIRNFDNHSKILSEEFSNKIDIIKESNFWLIDPLDGTLNYVSNIPIYCISVAFVSRNSIQFGFVINLNSNEIFHAYKKKGAFFNGKKILNNSSENLINISTASILDKNISIKLKNISKGYALRNIGSQSLALCYLANGSLSAVINNVAKIWDDLAGILIINESNNHYYSKLNNLKQNFKFDKNLYSIAIHNSKPLLKKKILEIQDRKRYNFEYKKNY